MQASPGLIVKLVHLRTDLEREFPEVAADRVDDQMQLVVSDLLPQAHFDQFVPLLVRRRVRFRLIAEARRA